jgi:hypothetical protein
MSVEHALELVLLTLDPNNLLKENSLKHYSKELRRTMTSIETDVAYQRKLTGRAIADVKRYASWCRSQCPVLSGLKIYLEEDGELQDPLARFPCRCPRKSRFCHEYENEYELKLRMLRGKQVVIDLHYVFSQTQQPKEKGAIQFDDPDVDVRVNDFRVAFLEKHGREKVLEGLREFIWTFCYSTIPIWDYIKEPGARDASPTRQ